MNINKKHLNYFGLSVVIAVLSAFNIFFTLEFYRQSERAILAEIHQSFQKIDHVIDDSLNGLVKGLNGIKGAFAAARNKVNREDFHRYAESRNYFKEFRGVLGFGFSRKVSREDFSQYVYNNRKTLNDFVIKYRGIYESMPEYYNVIEMIEPMDINRAAIGLELNSEKNRREAAQKSMDEGRPILTAQVNLVQVHDKKVGFLYMSPVYKTGYTPATVDERRSQLIGWAYTPILIEQLMKDVYVNVDGRLNVDIIDITSGEDDVLYQSEKSIQYQPDYKFISTKILDFGGRQWKIVASPKYDLLRFQKIFTISILCLIECIIFLLAYLYFKNSKLRFSAEENALKKDDLLLKKERQILNIINNVPSLISYWDLEFNKKYANDAFKDFFKIEKDLKGAPLNLQDAIRTDLFIKFRPHLQKCAKGENSFVEINHIKNELPYTFLTQFIPNLDNEKAIGIFIILTDISDLKKSEAEKELIQAKLAQHAKMAALGEMSGGIAHEINNPLAVMVAKAAQIKNRISKGVLDTSVMIRDLEKIESTGLRIAGIVKGLRAFSRNADQDPMIQVKFSEILEDTFELCQQRFLNHDILVESSGDLDFIFECRPTEISQVLMNLLNNSFDAIKNTKIRWIKIHSEIQHDRAIISVTDSGQSIQSEVRHKIFQPFFTTKEIGHGTGLGLSISKGIVEAHRGRIYYDDSSENTRFVLEFAIAKTQEKIFDSQV